MILPLPIRTCLFSLGFRIKKQSLQEVPSISITDLGLIPLLGRQKAFSFFRFFQTYRNNLKQAEWSCLTNIYPRSYYLLYFFLLFWWADYCNALKSLVGLPDRSLIAELFFRYIIEVDRLIDDSSNGYLLLKAPHLIKNSPIASKTLEMFFVKLSDSDIMRPTKHQMCHLFWSYRNECLLVCQQVLHKSNIGLDNVLYFKQKTTGGLFRIWSALLCSLYHDTASRELAENSGLILYEASMAMQVLEDLLDLPADRNVGIPNIVYEILRMYPSELEVFESYRKQYKCQHMDGVWAKEKLPNSYQAAMELVDHYLAASMKVSLKPFKTAELCCLISKGQSHPIGV